MQDQPGRERVAILSVPGPVRALTIRGVSGDDPGDRGAVVMIVVTAEDVERRLNLAVRIAWGITFRIQKRLVDGVLGAAVGHGDQLTFAMETLIVDDPIRRAYPTLDNQCRVIISQRDGQVLFHPGHLGQPGEVRNV